MRPFAPKESTFIGHGDPRNRSRAVLKSRVGVLRSARADPTPRAGVAQLVEQLIRNQQVVRSIRIAGSIHYQ